MKEYEEIVIEQGLMSFVKNNMPGNNGPAVGETGLRYLISKDLMTQEELLALLGRRDRESQLEELLRIANMQSHQAVRLTNKNMYTRRLNKVIDMVREG